MSTKIRRATRSYRCARCGYSKSYENAGAVEARYWFNSHSCQKRERLLLREVMTAVRKEAIDRTPQPCLHKFANHQHGERATYCLDKCRCIPCSEANARAEDERKRMKAYGRYNKYVDAHPVRLHLAELREYGIGLKTVARLTGLGNGTLTKIWYGTYADTGRGHERLLEDGQVVRSPSRRVLRSTAERIYAIEPIPANLGSRRPDHERSPIARTHLRALVALGWSQSKLAALLDIERGNFAPMIHGPRVLGRSTVDAIEALYAEICMKLPPETNQRERIAASRARNYAAEHGWLPPLALDDLEIDLQEDEDLEDLIDEVAVQRALDGDRTVKLTKAEREEIVRLGQERGITLKEIERLTGLKPDRYLKREAS